MEYLAVHQILKSIQNEIPGRSKIRKINAERNMPSVTVHPMHAKRCYFSNTSRALLILKCIQSVTIPQMHAKRYCFSNACKALLFLKCMQSVIIPQKHAKRYYSSLITIPQKHATFFFAPLINFFSPQPFFYPQQFIE